MNVLVALINLAAPRDICIAESVQKTLHTAQLCLQWRHPQLMLIFHHLMYGVGQAFSIKENVHCCNFSGTSSPVMVLASFSSLEAVDLYPAQTSLHLARALEIIVIYLRLWDTAFHRIRMLEAYA